MEQKDKDFFSEAVDKVKNFAKNTPDYTEEYDQEDIKKNKDICILSYIGIFFILTFIICRNSKFGRFHTNQGLVLFLSELVLSVAAGFGKILTFNLFSGIVSAVISIVSLFYLVVGIMNAVNGRAKELPVIGKIRLIN